MVGDTGSLRQEDASAKPAYAHDPDVRLMLLVCEGDDEAFSRLVANWQDRLVGVLSHLLQSREAAEDLAQETFLRVYRARLHYQPTARFSTWLFRIAGNLASNWRRTRLRRKEVALSASGQEAACGQLSVDESAFWPARLLAQHELQQQVHAALAERNERQRLAVLLSKFEQMSHAEVGNVVDMTPAAVKSLLHRA